MQGLEDDLTSENSICGNYATDEKYFDFIVENNASFYDETALGCVVRVDENWSVGYGELPKGLSMTVADLNYHTIPKLYSTVEDNRGNDTSSFDSSGISSILAQPLLDVKGRDVIIGVIDTGIDYTLDIFKDSSINSKIGVIWNQTDKKQSDEANPLFGKVYYKSDINRALAAMEEGLETKNSVPTGDDDGHGTKVAGIAISAAPEAELAVVKLKPAKEYLRQFFFIPDGQTVYEETDIMLGVKFLLDYAKSQKKPLVILLALATGSGSRTGATPLARVLSSAAERTNVAVVTAVGNEADSRAHTFGQIGKNPYSCELNVGANADGIVLELWAGNMDILSVGFVSPSGESVARIPARERSSYTHDFIFEKTQIRADYQVVEELSGFELIFIKMLKPAPGVWKINVYSSLEGVQGQFNMWLNMKKLIGSDAYFLRSNPDTTLLEPSADGRVISVGSCNHRTGGIDVDSGRGYNARGEVKPDVVAPGVGIVTNYASNAKIMGFQTTITGTSASSAHVAGMAALLFQWGVTDGNDRLMGNNQVKSILTRGAQRDVNSANPVDTYPNPTSGYGKANILESFLQLRIY
jgi:subtilisin family serine protease